MSLSMVWVHRRHKDHPDVALGRRYVEPDVAADLIAENCAQPWQTDVRQLKPLSQIQPKQREPKPTATRKKRAYKRRDIRAEA